jgi:hypothetical protein
MLLLLSTCHSANTTLGESLTGHKTDSLYKKPVFEMVVVEKNIEFQTGSSA